MSLESELARLNSNIEKLIPLLSSAPATTEEAPKKTRGKAAPAAPAESTPPPAPEVTEESVLTLVTELLNAGKKDDIKKLNAKHGCERWRTIFGTDKFAAYWTELQTLKPAA